MNWTLIKDGEALNNYVRKLLQTGVPVQLQEIAKLENMEFPFLVDCIKNNKKQVITFVTVTPEESNLLNQK
jgi:hypothetical protein